MDFIEPIFGFAPDNGDGTFAILLFAIPGPRWSCCAGATSVAG